MVRKKDIITICERHPDCEFLSFTNGTLIDEEFCQEMLRVKNFVPAISLEGFETANDGRRGPGVFDKVKHAMQLLKEHNLPFGISTCYTSMNYKDITSEEFYDMIIEAGALFIWFFHYMPVGNDAAPELMPNQSREKLYTNVSVLSEAPNQSSVWTSRMMRNTSADVSQADVTTCTSMQPEMWILVYSSIIRMPISMKSVFWMH